MIWVSTAIALIMGISVFAVRMKASERPTNLKKIILPPFFMSTGALMFLFPVFQLTSSEVFEAVIAGVVFSLLLIKTSKFEVHDDEIYLQRSKAFVFILAGLVIVRLIAKIYLSKSIEVGQLGGMFFLLAFSMIVPWRVAMVIQFKKIQQKYFGTTKIIKA